MKIAPFLILYQQSLATTQILPIRRCGFVTKISVRRRTETWIDAHLVRPGIYLGES